MNDERKIIYMNFHQESLKGSHMIAQGEALGL